MAAQPPQRHRVALQGFTAFERSALASYFRLSASPQRVYEQVERLDLARFVIADTDHPGAVAAVRAARRMEDTVFVGAHAPEEAVAWTLRPIDPLHLLRELDALDALRNPQAARVPLLPSRARLSVLDIDLPLPTPSRRATDSPVIGERFGLARGDDALVLDGSRPAGQRLERQLRGMGLRTERVASPAVVLERLAVHAVGFVFLETDLGDGPAGDGLALCQRIKRSGAAARETRVVLMSERRQAVDQVRARLAGADGWLAKPIEEQALRRLLGSLGARLRRAPAAAAADLRTGA